MYWFRAVMLLSVIPSLIWGIWNLRLLYIRLVIKSGRVMFGHCAFLDGVKTQVSLKMKDTGSRSYTKSDSVKWASCWWRYWISSWCSVCGMSVSSTKHLRDMKECRRRMSSMTRRIYQGLSCFLRDVLHIRRAVMQGRGVVSGGCDDDGTDSSGSRTYRPRVWQPWSLMSTELTWVRKWRRRVCWKKTEMMDERDDHPTHSTPSITHFDLHSLPICVSLFLLKSTTIPHPQFPQHFTWYPSKTPKVHDYSLEGSLHTLHITIKGISRLLT